MSGTCAYFFIISCASETPYFVLLHRTYRGPEKKKNTDIPGGSVDTVEALLTQIGCSFSLATLHELRFFSQKSFIVHSGVEGDCFATCDFDTKIDEEKGLLTPCRENN